MKIREKLFLILLAVIILFTVAFNVVALRIFQTHLEKDKLTDAQNTLKQILLSYEYVSSDISDYVFDSLRQEEIAAEISYHREDPAALKMKLKNIVRNHSALIDGFVVFDDKVIFTSDCSSRETYSQNWQMGIFDTAKDTFWTVDDGGRLYLRRNIYRVSPYEMIGYAVFEIDTSYLKTLVGTTNIACGQVCILDIYGNILLTSGHAAHDDPLFLRLIDQLSRGETLERETEFGGIRYHVIAVNSAVGSDKAIYTVSNSELLYTFFLIQETLYRLVALMLLLAALISFSVSNGFTRNLRILRKNVNRITHDSDENLEMRLSAVSADEIGALAEDINSLLARLENVHKVSLKHMKDSQNAKYELLKWQYHSLQSQVSPHFLCNILSAICTLSATNNTSAVQKLAVDSSRYLRSNLNSCDKEVNTLEEEIRLIKEYVSLVDTISAVPMELRIVCPEELNHALVPTYLLQPLVENSVKYGITPEKQERLIIAVDVAASDNGIVTITVSDNGDGYSESALMAFEQLLRESSVIAQNAGIGIYGIARRLKLIYRDNCRIYVYNLPEGGACTALELPLTQV